MKKIKFKYVMFMVLLTFFVMSVANASNGNIEKQKIISFLDKNNIIIEYSKKYMTNDKKEILVYEDEESNEYFYKNGDVVAYIKNQNKESVEEKASIYDSENNTKNSDENIKSFESIASSYLNNLVKPKSRATTMDYELIDSTYLEATEEYSYIYSKKIGEYVVNDGILISLDKNGELISFSGAQQGLYDNYFNISIEEDDVNEFVKDEMLKNKIQNYEIDTQFINFVDNKLVLQIGITIINKDDMLSSMFLYYDL